MKQAAALLHKLKGVSGFNEAEKSVKTANSADLKQYAKNAGYVESDFVFSKYMAYDAKKREHTFAVVAHDKNEDNFVVDTMYVSLGVSGLIEGDFGGNGNPYDTKDLAIAAAKKLK